MGESYSCGYHGHEFGASYPDSLCIDGELWDADSGDGDGYFTSGGEIACPRCNTAAYLRRAHSDAQDGGCGVSMFEPWVAMILWEAAIIKARRENLSAAEEFLATLTPFRTEDWPDRHAVYEGRARWDDTVEREWRYEPAQASQVQE